MGQQRVEVLAELRRLITHGYFRWGQLFSENELIEKLGVSRSPIREALAVLAQEGIVEQLHRKGVMVRFIGEAETREVLRLRHSIEEGVVEELSGNPLTSVEPLLAAMDAADEANDVAAFLDADTEFHCSLARLAGYGAAADMLRSLRDKIRIVGLDSLQQRHPDLADANKSHRELVRAIRDDNPSLARLILAKHLDATARLITRDPRENVSPESQSIKTLVDSAREYRRKDGKLTKAIDLLEQAADIGAQSDELHVQLVQVLLELGTTRRHMRDFRTARKHALRALEVSELHGDRAGQAWATSELGRISVEVAMSSEDGSPTVEADYLEQALRLYEEQDLRGEGIDVQRGWTHYGLAVKAHNSGDVLNAEREARSALRWLRDSNDGYGEAAALELLGEVALAAQNTSEAFRLFAEARDVALRGGYVPIRASVALEEGRLMRQSPEVPAEKVGEKLREARDLFLFEGMEEPGLSEAVSELELVGPH